MKTMKQVTAYGEKMQKELGLSHWRIEFRNEDEDNGSVTASCEVIHAYNSAVIRVYNEFWEKCEKDKKEIIIHELLHCCFGFWDKPVNNLRKDPSISDGVINTLTNTLVDAEETCVELLARAIYKMNNK